MKNVCVFAEDTDMNPVRMAIFNRRNYDTQEYLAADVQAYIDLLNGCGYDYNVKIQLTDVGGIGYEDNSNSDKQFQ